MSSLVDRLLLGRWRIVWSDLWGREHLDLVGPATLNIGANGVGEIAFGALEAGLDLSYGSSVVTFTWHGFDDLHEVNGSGSAELLEDGALEVEFAYDNGDDALLRAEREGTSPAE